MINSSLTRAAVGAVGSVPGEGIVTGSGGAQGLLLMDDFMISGGGYAMWDHEVVNAHAMNNLNMEQSIFEGHSDCRNRLHGDAALRHVIYDEDLL